MQGLVYTINKLGEALAQAEADVAMLRQRVKQLEEQIAADGEEGAPPPSPKKRS
jgi:uncharacterized coiled-coil protein SlyX